MKAQLVGLAHDIIERHMQDLQLELDDTDLPAMAVIIVAVADAIEADEDDAIVVASDGWTDGKFSSARVQHREAMQAAIDVLLREG